MLRLGCLTHDYYDVMLISSSQVDATGLIWQNDKMLQAWSPCLLFQVWLKITCTMQHKQDKFRETFVVK